MLKLLGKLVAAWLTAFAIAGITVWAGTEEDLSESETAAGNDRAGIAVSPAASRSNAAD